MTNLQLYLAVGLPTFAVVASLILSLVQVAGIRGEISAIRDDLREMRRTSEDLRREVNTKIDLLTGKVYELMGQKG